MSPYSPLATVRHCAARSHLLPLEFPGGVLYGLEQPVDLLHHALVVDGGRLVVAQQRHLAGHPRTLAYLTDTAHLTSTGL